MTAGSAAAVAPVLGTDLATLRRTRTSLKWQAYAPDVLPAWVAEMDARQDEAVVAAVTAALERGDTGYAWARPFADALAGFARDRWGWAPDPRRAFPVADVMTGIAELVRARVPADAGVVVSPPCYDAFYGFIGLTGRRRVLAPLDAQHRLDPDALERAFTEAGPGSAYLLCNPQNPTGTCHTAAELTTLAELADRHQVLVIADEIHAPLVQPGGPDPPPPSGRRLRPDESGVVDPPAPGFVPYLSLPAAQRGVAVHSASKAWNLAGLKAALLVPGEEAGEHVRALPEVVTHGANHVAVLAQTAAFAEGRPWLDQLLTELADRRRLLTALLAEQLPQVRPVPAQATYLAWLDCSGLGLADPAGRFLEQGRVALVPGTRYDPVAGDRWVRFNLGTSAEVVTEAVRRMAAAVA